MPKITIRIKLPKNRWNPGTIQLENEQGQIVGGPWLALGKSSDKIAKENGNPSREKGKPYGDTPTGTFAAVDALKSGRGTNLPAKSYGKHGVIRLHPLRGQASKAFYNGRYGIWIHAGRPNPLQINGLRSTSGCVRVSDRTMSRLMKSLLSANPDGGSPVTVKVEKLDPEEVDNSVVILPEVFDFTMSDPPPTMYTQNWAVQEPDNEYFERLPVIFGRYSKDYKKAALKWGRTRPRPRPQPRNPGDERRGRLRDRDGDGRVGRNDDPEPREPRRDPEPREPRREPVDDPGLILHKSISTDILYEELANLKEEVSDLQKSLFMLTNKNYKRLKNLKNKGE